MIKAFKPVLVQSTSHVSLTRSIFSVSVFMLCIVCMPSHAQARNNTQFETNSGSTGYVTQQINTTNPSASASGFNPLNVSNQAPVVNDLESGFEEDDAFSVDGNTPEEADETISDPLSGYNRWMFGLNVGLDKRIMRPVAKGYKKHTPGFVRKGVTNFFRNLAEPVVSVNLLLQGRPGSALESFSRFGVNTVTTFGFGDPAGDELKLEHYNEDFGQTLGTWGVPAGPYVVLPLFGPSSLRDAGGRVVDSFGSPISHVDNVPAKVVLTGANGLDKRTALLKYEGIFEPEYEVIRDAYLQKREFDINSHNENSEETENSGFEEGFGE